MTDRLDGFQAFIRVFESRSFSAVARELGVSQPTVSKRVAAVEAHFGVQLFTRTTRKIHPTPDATRLYDHVKRLLEELEGAENSVGRESEAPGGMLRITAPAFFGRLHIIPRLCRYFARYPNVRIDVRLTDSQIDLIASGIELAIRIGDLPSSSLVARRIGTAQPRLLASAGYLARRGEPFAPEDLRDHDCIVYSGFPRPDRLIFESEFGRRVVSVNGILYIDNADAIREAVEAGLGVALIPAWGLEQSIASGRVKVLLPEFPAPSLPINAVYPDTRWLAHRTRSFIDFLVEEFAGPGALRG